MSYTITTGKKAGVLQLPNGDYVYALFEKTHESNVYPHTPQWSCTGFGTYEQVLELVIRYAAYCPGGCLQSKSGGGGYIKPENYIAAWRRAIHKPFVMAVGAITVSMNDLKWMIKGNDKAAAAVSQVFEKHGRSDLKSLICDENARVELHWPADAGLIMDLFGPSGPFSAWRAFSHSDLTETQLSIPLPEKSKDYVVPVSQAYKLLDGGFLVKHGDGEWRHETGNSYVMGAYVRTVIQEAESKVPGISKSMCQQLRDTLEQAVGLPAMTKVMVSIKDDTKDFAKESIERCMTHIGKPMMDGKGEFTWTDVIHSPYDYNVARFTSFPDLDVTWHVEQSEQSPSPRPVHMVAQGSLELAA